MSRTDERGGILVAFLAFMTLAILALSLYGIRWAQLWDSQRLRGICRAELAQTYAAVGQKAQDLLEMNRTVENLRIAERAAQAALAAATVTLFAPGIEAALRTLEWIRRARKILRLRQKYLIHSANWLLFKVRLDLQRQLRATSGHLGLVDRQVETQWGLPVRLAVRPADQDPELPKYELMPDFERRQGMEFKWQSRYRAAGAREDQWKIANMILPESCGMTLVARGSTDRPRFEAQPTQAKYFWKR